MASDQTEKKRPEVIERAGKLVRSAFLFWEILIASARQGLVGERRNALAVYVVCTSRLLAQPLNLMI